MDRRTFLKTSTVAAAATTSVVGAAKAAAPPQYALNTEPAGNSDPAGRRRAEGTNSGHASRAHWLELARPPAAPLADAAFQLARDIESATDGRVRLAFVEGADRGAPAAAFGILSDLIAPPLALFGGLPGPAFGASLGSGFGSTSGANESLAVAPADLLAWHSAGGGALFLDEAAGEHGFKALIAGHSGAGIGLWSDTDVADLRAFAAARFSAGCGPVNAEASANSAGDRNSGLDAISRRVFDRIRSAFPAGGMPADIRRACVCEIAATPLEAYASLAPTPSLRQTWHRDGLHEHGLATALVLPRRAWAALSAGDQHILEAVSERAAYRSLAGVRAGRVMANAVWPRLPVARRTLPLDVRQALEHTALTVSYEVLEADPTVRRALSAYRGFLQAVLGYSVPNAGRGANANMA